MYEPTVKANHLSMPASVSMQEGETLEVAVNWTGGAADTSGLQENGVVILPAAIAAVNGGENDSIRVALEGNPGSRWVRIDALEDADWDDDAGEYQLYFGGARALWNGKYAQTLTVNVTDNDEEPEETATATVTATPIPLTVSLSNNPAHHNGVDAFSFDIHFNEENPVGYRTLKHDAFTVTGGQVQRAQRLQTQPRSNIGWRITVHPGGRDDVAVTLPATQDCEAVGAICARDGRKLSNVLSFTVPWQAPPNTPATGAPAIIGIPRIGATLTADTSATADGLTNPAFEYQWIRSDFPADIDIGGATTATYMLTDADHGLAIRVRVDFTDDNGHEESLTSASVLVTTLAVSPAPPTAVSVPTAASQELRVSWDTGSGGSAPTGFKVQWKSGNEQYDGSTNSARQAIVTGTDASTYTVSGLTDGAAYTLRVIAYNAGVDGVASAEATGSPEPPNFIVILAADLVTTTSVSTAPPTSPRQTWTGWQTKGYSSPAATCRPRYAARRGRG